MFFTQIPEGPPDPVFGLSGAFQADPRPSKISLLVGIYRDEELKAPQLAAVVEAKRQILSQDLVADYLPIDGYPPFLHEIGQLVFGVGGWKSGASRIYAAQSIGGTGALRTGAEFLVQEVSPFFSISHLTWPNHRQIFERASCQIATHPYYNREKGELDFAAWCGALEKLAPRTVVVLHACCHNPTGCDPTEEQWKELSLLMLRKQLVPFFDFAYQGFGDGLERDALAIQIFFRAGHEMLIAYSCSKNFSLYCQRVGALFAVTGSPIAMARVGSQIKRIVRAAYSNPPAHGAKIVAHLLADEQMRRRWQTEVDAMRHRLTTMREAIARDLIAGAKTNDYRFLRKQKGMFACLNINPQQVERLKEEFGVYLLENGRFSLAGLNKKNKDAVAEALLAVCEL